MFRALMRSVSMSGPFRLFSLMRMPFPPEILGAQLRFARALIRQLAVRPAQLAGSGTVASLARCLVTQSRPALKRRLAFRVPACVLPLNKKCFESVRVWGVVDRGVVDRGSVPANHLKQVMLSLKMGTNPPLGMPVHRLLLWCLMRFTPLKMWLLGSATFLM